MTKIIDVKETINDNKSEFNIKRFHLGTIHSENSIKTIDTRKTNKKNFEPVASQFKNIVFETPKRIDAISIKNVLSKNDSYVKDFFGYSEWIHNFENVITPTFTFNPYSIYKKVEDLSGFFKYYYSFSKTFSFVPNINAIETIYGIGSTGRPKKIEDRQIIKIEDYINFVNESYHILDEKNNKPIFVPLSLKFVMDDTVQLVKEYISKGYSHIWVDFEGASTTDLSKIPKLNQCYSMLRRSELFDSTIFYATNVRREITTNKYKDENPSSDILTSLCGGNFVGINQARVNPNPPPIPVGLDALQNLWEHAARVFNPDTYYYVRRNLANIDSTTSENLLNEQYRGLFNTKQLDNEIKKQADQFLLEFDFEEYICNKKMLSTYSEGTLRKKMFYKKYEGVQARFDEFDDFKMF